MMMMMMRFVYIKRTGATSASWRVHKWQFIRVDNEIMLRIGKKENELKKANDYIISKWGSMHDSGNIICLSVSI